MWCWWPVGWDGGGVRCWCWWDDRGSVCVWRPAGTHTSPTHGTLQEQHTNNILTSDSSLWNIFKYFGWFYFSFTALALALLSFQVTFWGIIEWKFSGALNWVYPCIRPGYFQYDLHVSILVVSRVTIVAFYPFISCRDQLKVSWPNCHSDM